MRWRKGRAVIKRSLLLAGVLCASSAVVKPRPSTIRGDRCAVALAYIDVLLARPSKIPRVFSIQQESAPDLPKPRDWMDTHLERRGASPSQALLRQLSNDTGQNAVVSCASVRKSLDRRHIRYGDSAADEAARTFTGSSYRSEILSVSLPVISRDGKEALLTSSSVSGPLAAGGSLEYLRRQPSGGWAVVSSAELWVS
jgi:hypothetical protein